MLVQLQDEGEGWEQDKATCSEVNVRVPYPALVTDDLSYPPAQLSSFFWSIGLFSSSRLLFFAQDRVFDSI